LQLLSRDFISIFHAKFRYLAQKTDILSFARKYLTNKKDWGPTKNFQGPPAPRGPGNPPPLPPPLDGPGPAYLIAQLVEQLTRQNIRLPPRSRSFSSRYKSVQVSHHSIYIASMIKLLQSDWLRGVQLII
jgi:hypothetical protein